MIHIFNRKELLATFDRAEQAHLRDMLASNNIDYTVKTVNRTSPSPFSAGQRSRAGSFGSKQDSLYEYIIYVHRDDFERAASIIRK